MKSVSSSDGGSLKEDHDCTDAMRPRDLTGEEDNSSGAAGGQESRTTTGCDRATAASISSASDDITEEDASRVEGSAGTGARKPVDPEESLCITANNDGAVDGRSEPTAAESCKISIADTKRDGQGTGPSTSSHALLNQNTVMTERPLDQDTVTAGDPLELNTNIAIPTSITVQGQRSSPVHRGPGAYRVRPRRRPQRTHSGNGDAADFQEDAAALTAPELRCSVNAPVFEGRLVEEGSGRQEGATDESSSAFVVTGRGNGFVVPTSQRSSGAQLIDLAVEHIRHISQNAPLVEGISITDTQNVKPSSGWKTILCKHGVMSIMLATVFVAAAAGSAAAVVTIMRRRRNTVVAGDPGENPSAGTAQFKELRRVVSAVSNEGALSDPTSPQFAALSWLANEDELLPYPLQDAKAVIQRYVMALFYVSTGGENWAGNDLFEAASTHCMHYATTCWEMFEGIEMERMGPGRPYLSSALHECEWEGVGCYEGTDVVGAISILNNNLTGVIPQEIGALKLQELHLPSNKIGGTIPNSIQYFGGYIKSIILSFNLLTGTIPDIFSTLPNLTYFGCSVNPLNGTIPQSLNGHKNLIKFYATWAGLSGTIPLDFNTMPSLELIMLDSNALSGPIPPSIAKWSNAVHLGLSVNQLMGTIPDFLGGLSGLKLLYLGANHLSGTIPSSLLDLKNLVALDLSKNYLTGTTPENLGGARSLQLLSLENNGLTGTIPASIGDLENLQLLSLENSGLTGTIPASVGDLKNLWVFRAHSNSLTGTIPATIGDNPSLGFLELGNNKLVGTFPDTFKSAFTLEHLDLSKNDLTGNLNFLCDLDIPIMYADCGGQKAEIDCDCCLVCCSDEEEIAGCNDYLTTWVFDIRYCNHEGLGSIICGGA